MYLNPFVMSKPEICINYNYLKFDKPTGDLTDPETKKFLHNQMEAFADFIDLIKMTH